MAGAAPGISGARTFAPADRSHGHLRASDRHALSAEIAVEQDIAAEHVRADGRSHRLVDARHRRQLEARAPGAEDDRRHHDVETIEASRSQETRDGVGAAFDEDAAKAASSERLRDRSRGELAVAACELHDLDLPRKARRRINGGDHQPAHIVSRQHARVAWQSTFGIDDHARGIWTGDPAHGQLRIVGDRGADPDDHRVDQGAQAVQVGEAGFPVDVMGMAGGGCDAGIDGLPALADEHELVDRPVAQRTEDVLPRPGQGLGPVPERRGNRAPRSVTRRAVTKDVRSATKGVAFEPTLGLGASRFAPLGKAPIGHPGYLLSEPVSSCHDILQEPGCQRPS